MKALSLLLAAAVWALGTTCRAEETSRVIVVTSAGAVDGALAAHLAAWARTNLALPVEAKAPVAAAVKNIDQTSEVALRPRADREVLQVVLFQTEENSIAHGVLRPEQGVALVNVGAMRADSPSAEKLQARMERQVIRAICMLMGLESSPNPFSAMTTYRSMEELDAIGRNLDPPWLVKLQHAAEAKGLAVDHDNPFCMIP